MTFSGQYIGAELAHTDHQDFTVTDVTFEDIDLRCLYGTDAHSIDELTITGCTFRDAKQGAMFSIWDTGPITVTDNEFVDVWARGLTLGDNGDTVGADVRNNTFRRMKDMNSGGDSRAIVSYIDNATIANNHFEDIAASGRHEAISSRGSDTVIRDNTMIDAGGKTGAISLASLGPTTIADNYIEFTDDHDGQHEAINCRQANLDISGNEIVGSSTAINLRRGGQSSITDNHIHDSPRQRYAIMTSISTGNVVPEEHMGNVTIEGNEVSNISKSSGDGLLTVIRFNIRDHGGDHDTHQDDTTVSNNFLADIDVADTVRGIHFANINRDDSHMRGVEVSHNAMLGCVDELLSGSVSHVEDLDVHDNIECGEAIGSSLEAIAKQHEPGDRVGYYDVLSAISAYNSGEELFGHAIEFQDVLDAIAAHREGTRV